MNFKFLKKLLSVLLIISIFVTLNIKAYDLFLDVNIWGLCTIVKVHNDKKKIVWKNNFLTPELLQHIKKEDLSNTINYLNTLKHKRIKNTALKTKIKRYIRMFNKNKEQYSEQEIFKFSSLIFATALKGVNKNAT
ncbi:MAG: hypothetical protein IJI84_06060 [Clostridia bacterium]|nr:hypothetical protein [Clostridia bacterium]